VPYKTPVARNYQRSFSIQRQLPGGILAEAAYVGSHAKDISYRRDLNQVPVGKLGPGDAQSKRPYPQYLAIQANFYDAFSNYNSLQLSLTKRLSRGLSGGINYTWSKFMSSQDSSGWGGSGSVYQITASPNLMYALSNNDVPKMLKGSAVYELPIGKGKKLLNQGGVLNAIVGGWKMSSVFTAQSGSVFTPMMSGANNSGSQAGNWFPNVVGNPHLSNWTIAKYFNPAAFAQPAAFTFGNAGRNILRGPGLAQIDFSLAKVTRIPVLGESGQLQLRFDATNAINHPCFSNPDANIGSASVARITGTSVAGRFLQLGVRLAF
jgi:hypothetical protein